MLLKLNIFYSFFWQNTGNNMNFSYQHRLLLDMSTIGRYNSAKSTWNAGHFSPDADLRYMHLGIADGRSKLMGVSWHGIFSINLSWNIGPNFSMILMSGLLCGHRSKSPTSRQITNIIWPQPVSIDDVADCSFRYTLACGNVSWRYAFLVQSNDLPTLSCHCFDQCFLLSMHYTTCWNMRELCFCLTL